MSPLKGQTVFITGGARHLGSATALAMAQAGANVAFTFRSSADEAGQTLKRIQSTGVQGMALECDQRKQESVDLAVDEVLRQFGQIDLLINNAGVFETANFEDITVEQWDEVFAVNVRGPFLVSQRAIPSLRRARGRIINLGSLGGEKPWATHAHYCSSKAALHMLTRVMTKALAPEIAVNCVAPGMIATEKQDPQLLARLAERTPMKKNGSPEDVVSAVLYFATTPHFITGQVLTVDGGLGLR